MNIDSIHARPRRPVAPAKNSATPANVEALEILLGKLARWEESDDSIGRTYRGCLADREAKVQARALAK